jgi:hypothetical protein
VHGPATVDAALSLASEAPVSFDQGAVSRCTRTGNTGRASSPQHGPGKKHRRPIVLTLTQWPERLADQWPAQHLAGLIHSDGCRFENTGTNWSSPRYVFKQLSRHIQNIFCDACDRLGLHWTQAGDAVYISRRSDVARLDSFIGPKR